MRFSDSHCHLDAPEFDADRGAVMAHAKAAGVWRQLLPAIDLDSSQAIWNLHFADATLLPAFGFHPMYLDRYSEAGCAALAHLVATHRPVAIGECGLDYFVEGLDHQQQSDVLGAHLRLAVDHGLPVILHARRAVDAVIAQLRRFRPTGGVVHSFSGSWQQAEQLFALGFSLGIGGPVTYERAQRLRDIVRRMPIEFLLLETDAPDQPSCSLRGQRHTPGDLLLIAKAVADLRSISLEALSAATEANFSRLFGPPAT
ncbi:DNAase [Ahniella affigens]|uniref:DNAase n=1 Tax=Ahniella affigens TaxID=2021234 RepID=A0A2P1PYY8_9GAMM|nr:TatD family hydrolase [Ahniella affigens]AVQ00046.1 DNAase [Ahniella affigens]